MKKILIILSVLFIFISCGNEPPLINNTIYNILIYQKGSLNIPQDSMFLSVFFNIEDENGLEDIIKISITHIDTEYIWNLPLDILNRNTVWNERNYIGYSFLEYNNASTVLTGDYLIEAEDKSGNITSASFAVEIDGVNENTEFKIPEIKYEIQSSDKKEIKINNEQYNSCEIKVLNDASLFNGGRKKYKSNAKILISDQPMPQNTLISVKINKDPDEKFVYYLKDYTLK